MYRIIRFIDDLLDKLMILSLILLLLIGCYFMYDTAYVFYHASADRVGYVRPGEEVASGKRMSDDYVAWLTLEDTDIDYPVMQGESNSKYLNLDPYGEYALSGSIFLDCRNAADFSDSYSLLYGHHMANGLMFGALDAFHKESYFEQHTAGTLSVGGREYALYIFAVLSVDAGERDYFNPNGSDPILKSAKDTSIFYRPPDSGRVLALSTCVDADSTARTVVLCSMTEKTEEN